MTTEMWHGLAKRLNIFQASVHDRELAQLAHHEAVIDEVRRQLAKAIVDKIMEKLGPVLDAALKEVGHP